MYLTLILWTIGGAALGALMGSTRSCEDGGCPLTATPWRGAAYGAALGLFFAWSACASGSGSCPLTSCGTALTGRSTAAMAKSEHVTEVSSADEFEQQVLSGSDPAVVVFYSNTCPPCARYHPVVEKTAQKLGGEARFYQINTDVAGKLVQALSIRGTPTTLIINDGELQKKLVGYQDEDSLMSAVQSTSETTADASAQSASKEV